MKKEITDPLLKTTSELIIEKEIQDDENLILKLRNDLEFFQAETESEILESMLRMHKYYEDYCGDLDVALNSTQEIKENTESWYVIFDGSSINSERIIRLHYRCNWETDHGVEVMLSNGTNVVFVGNCGNIPSSDSKLILDPEFNFKIKI